MYCLRYWARYVRKGEVKSRGIKLEMNQPLGSSWKGVLFDGVLDLNTLCRGCSSHTTLVGLLYPGRDKSENVCTGYGV